jgi:hypothetical protein
MMNNMRMVVVIMKDEILTEPRVRCHRAHDRGENVMVMMKEQSNFNPAHGCNLEHTYADLECNPFSFLFFLVFLKQRQERRNWKNA